MDIGTPNSPLLSSREIADMTAKKHDNLLKAIRKMEKAWIKINGVGFNVVDYQDAKGEMRPEYQLSKKECLYIATKFDDEARAILIDRWETLETAGSLQAPSNITDALQLAAKQAEQITQQQKLLEAQRPKVLFADSVAQAPDTILIRELALILAQNGVKIGEKRLFQYLRDEGFLVKRSGKDKNTPTQLAIEMGLLTLSERTFNNPKGSFITKTPYVTGKGQQYFVHKFLQAPAIN